MFIIIFWTSTQYNQFCSRKDVHFTEAEDEDTTEYIVEDRETEIARTRETAQWIQTAILWDLRQEMGVDAAIPEGAAKDLILQVTF